MKKILLILPALALVSYGSFAGDVDSLTAERDALKNRLAEVKSEVAKCEKQKKGGIAMTVIGAAGTVGTAVGVGIQAKQLKDKKAELKELEAEKENLSQKENSSQGQ